MSGGAHTRFARLSPRPHYNRRVQRIYLDHNATTPLDPRVLEAMVPVLRDTFGNASSIHWYGQQARAALDRARGEVAALLGCSPSEVVFTGSGTEADNLALQGLARAAREPRRKVLYAAVEHHAVLHTARSLAEDGWPVEAVRVDAEGRLDLGDLEDRLDDRTAVVAVMMANNETGVVQPVAEVVRLARARGASVHCDAVQAAGKLPLDLRALDVDTLAISAHKIYGPKGAGALFVRRNTKLRPFLRGGAQERNRRAGTENVAGIVGFGRAALLAREEGAADAARLAVLRDRLEALLAEGAGARPNGGGVRVANTSNLSFEGVEAESLLMALDLAGVAVSTGAACAAGAVEPSHVLRAMGLRPERVQGSLRFSLGRGTVADEVERAAAVVVEAVTRQRAAALRR
jgi:cysteine desulfurase